MVLFGCLVTSGAATEPPAEPVVIPLELQNGFPVVRGIFVNGHGPLTFLLDTGAQSSAMDSAIAARAGIRPAYRVELVTPAGIALVPAVPAAELSAAHVDGLAAIGTTEMLLQPMQPVRSAIPGVDGVLGMNALLAAPFLLDLENRQLVLRPEVKALDGATAQGILQDGRLLVDLLLPEVDPQPLRLAVDSAASSLLLFRAAHVASGGHFASGGLRPTGEARVRTAAGTLLAVTAELRNVRFAGHRLQPLSVAFLPPQEARPAREAGLLPVHSLSALLVNPATGAVVVQLRQSPPARKKERAALVSPRRP